MTAQGRPHSDALGILVTGAASGIGRGLVEHLAGQGHRLIATDIDQPGLARLPASVRTIVMDMASMDSIETAVRQLCGDPPQVLINNAGLQHVAPLEQFPPEKWQQLINVMLIGAAMLTRAVLPAMRAQGFGRIVNIGSVHSLIASPYKSAYVAAKHGLVGFSKVMALETRDCDITINTVCPSFVHTPLVDAQMQSLARTHGLSADEVVEEIMLKPMPKRAFIGIDELAAAVTYLLSDAARNITGQCITIDGGWTAQ